MSPDKTQRIVLITGSNRGIGLETARQLARRGFYVVIAARDEETGHQATETIQARGGKATFLSMDVSNSESIRNAASQFAAIADHLDVLVNNAGTFGPLEVTQAFLPYLRQTTAARAIYVSSGLGQFQGLSPDVPSYCLSKLSLNGLTIMLAKALHADRIAVNSMCPGWVRTDMGGPHATRSVEEGADTAVWLADDAPHELTGKFFRNRQEVPW